VRRRERRSVTSEVVRQRSDHALDPDHREGGDRQRERQECPFRQRGRDGRNARRAHARSGRGSAGWNAGDRRCRVGDLAGRRRVHQPPGRCTKCLRRASRCPAPSRWRRTPRCRHGRYGHRPDPEGCRIGIGGCVAADRKNCSDSRPSRSSSSRTSHVSGAGMRAWNSTPSVVREMGRTLALSRRTGKDLRGRGRRRGFVRRHRCLRCAHRHFLSDARPCGPDPHSASRICVDPLRSARCHRLVAPCLSPFPARVRTNLPVIRRQPEPKDSAASPCAARRRREALAPCDDAAPDVARGLAAEVCDWTPRCGVGTRPAA